MSLFLEIIVLLIKHHEKQMMETTDNRDQEKVARSILNDIDEMESIDIVGQYRHTMQKVNRMRMQAVSSRWMRYAALLTIPLLISSIVLGFLYFRKESLPAQYSEVFASQGSILKYVLPDNSVVWLNAGSRLKYPVKFEGDKREVSLSGEGYFEVTADKKHPFYVNVPGGLSVYVYGTHFDVNAYSSDPMIETVLEEGHLNVTSPNKQMMAQLIPGESAIYDKQLNKLIKIKVDDVYEKMAWRDGKLVFRHATPEELFKVLERHFNVKINFKNKSGRTYHFRATFGNETLEQILDYLSLSANMKWNIMHPVQNEDATFSMQSVDVTLY